MKKRWMAMLLAMCMLVGLLPVGEARAAQFTDISGHWAETYIERAAELGLFAGTGDGRFSPDLTMTRAMFVMCLANYSGENIAQYTTSAFGDVPSNAWYYHAVAWAYSGGIVSGTSSGTFSPNTEITREQMAVLLVKFANYQRVVLPRVRTGKLFSDSSQTGSWALDAVYTLYRAGIISGTSAQTYSPKSGATRAQCAVVLCKYAEVRSQNNTYLSEEQVPLVNHCGYNTVAPENTLAAFSLSVEYGYQYVETDVRFTKDNVPVLLHDATIDRTSNGSGSVAGMTYEQLLSYDFSCGKSAYSGTKIATFEEFMQLCSQTGLHPYVELKGTMTSSQVITLLSLAEQYGMQHSITWISSSLSNLKLVKKYAAEKYSNPYAPLCLVVNCVTKNTFTNLQSLQNGKNSVQLDILYTNLTSSVQATALRKGIGLCVWTVYNLSGARQLANTSVTAITTDNVTASQLYS